MRLIGEEEGTVALEGKEKTSAHPWLRFAVFVKPVSQIVQHGGAAVADIEPAMAEDAVVSAAATQAETRIYKGATYRKGDDRQWHLVRK